MNGQNELENLAYTDEVLTDIAVNLVIFLMKSASTDIIKPVDWWQRAKTALIVSASVAENYQSMISRYLEKIQVAAPRVETSEIIADTGRQLKNFGLEAWERFRYLSERDALYIVAMAQVENQERKKGFTK